MVNNHKKVLGGLTVEYASGFEPSADEIQKLVLSLELAKRVLASAIARLHTLSSGGPPLPSELDMVDFKALRWHYRLPKLEGDASALGRFKADNWRAWTEGMCAAAFTLTATFHGLSAPVAIADAYVGDDPVDVGEAWRHDRDARRKHRGQYAWFHASSAVCCQSTRDGRFLLDAKSASEQRNADHLCRWRRELCGPAWLHSNDRRRAGEVFPSWRFTCCCGW